MNIYARYFDRDVLVHNYEELIEFLSSIPEIPITPRMMEDVRAYVDSDMPYPRRYKIRPRVYFILIKTNAETMLEFKSHRKDSGLDGENVSMRSAESVPTKKEFKAALLSQQREGWYFGGITFKRVIQIAATSKFRYQDTDFSAYVYCNSPQECYDRIVNHLKNRTEVDLRSQFPSARGANFSFEYMGKELPEDVEMEM